jgi:putative peptidoglycan lipid II flippase
MKSFLKSLFSQKRIAGGAAVLALTQLLASMCGFLRDRAFSQMFPLDKDPLGVASVYIAAFRPSDLLFQITVMSCLSVILVPFLSSHLAHDRKEEMNRITTSMLVFFGGLFGLIALVLFFVFPWLAPQMVKFEGESLELYIRFGRIALLTNFLFVFGNTFGQYLISLQRYWIYGLTPILWSIGTIAGTYLLTPHFGAMGPMLGTLMGALAYVAFRLVGVARAGFRFQLPRGILHHEFRQMGWLIIPRMGALGALQLQLLLIDRLASGMDKQMLAINRFAGNFESVIPGIVGIAIAQSVFSLLSQAAAKKDHDRFVSNFRKGILYNLGIAIPGAAALAIMAPVAVWLLQIEGTASVIFTQLLVVYAIAVPFESTNYVLLRAFYSLKNTASPAISSVVSCVFAVGCGYATIGYIGAYSLVLSYVVAQVSQTLFLSLTLRRTLQRMRA